MSEASVNSINQIKSLVEKDVNPKVTFLRPKQGVERYNMSRNTFTKLALEAGALYKINSTILINAEAFEEYLENFRLRGLDG